MPVRNRAEAAAVALRGLQRLFAADAVILWMGVPGRRCTGDQIFSAGGLTADASDDEIARAIDGDRLEWWLGRLGAVLYCTTELTGDALTGVLVVAWRQTHASPDEVDAVLPMMATHLRAVAERERLVAELAARAARPPAAGPPRADAMSDRTTGAIEDPPPPIGEDQRGGTRAAELWRSLVAGAAHYLFVKDLDGRYVEANAAYLDALALSADRVIGSRDEDLLPPAVARAIAVAEHRVAVSGRTVEVITIATDATATAARTQQLQLANERKRRLLTEAGGAGRAGGEHPPRVPAASARLRRPGAPGPAVRHIGLIHRPALRIPSSG